MEQKKLSLKDYLTIAGIIFLTGGGWIKIQYLESEIEKINKINPQLIDYRLTQIERGIESLSKLVSELEKDN